MQTQGRLVMIPDASFEQALRQLRRGGNQAAAEVFDRFARRLIGLARRRMAPRLRRKLDPEDIVQSVFRTALRRLGEGQFELDSWDGLWRLLACVAVRKCARWEEHFGTARRDLKREGQADLGPDGSDSGWELFAREPAPDEVVALKETVEQVLQELPERERTIAGLVLQGLPVVEISRQARCTESKVYRVVRLVSSRLEERFS